MGARRARWQNMAKPCHGEDENQQLRKLDGIHGWQGRMAQIAIRARHGMFAMLRATIMLERQ